MTKNCVYFIPGRYGKVYVKATAHKNMLEGTIIASGESMKPDTADHG